MTHNQHLDDPAVRKEDDAFNRWPFSERLADTIANFDASAGAPVIGIYGRWGSGKTSVLNFLRSALAEKYDDKVVLHPFNPWLFKDPETLLQSFFAELGKAMQKSNKTLGDKVGKLLQDYSGLFGLIPVVGSAMGKIAEQGGKALTRGMEEVRDQVCETMSSAEKKVVVLIDDLDRLDSDEVLQMLKLVRLTANFPNVVYLLAFDDEMVGRAIAKKYGNDDDAGRQFLEKIVQYPFSLPAVSRERLMNFVEQQAKLACAQADIVLTKDDWETFQFFAIRCFAQRLTTPRQAIRYGNALRFALPLMKGEVSALDQMGVEGMRVLYPKLYATVRDNVETFTQAFDPEEYPEFSAPAGINEFVNSLEEEKIDRRVDLAMVDTSDDEKESARRLIGILFQVVPPKERGVARWRYFDRYFSYGVGTEEIGDVEIDALVNRPDTKVAEQAKAELLGRLFKRNAGLLLRLLLMRLPRFDRITALALAKLLAAIPIRLADMPEFDPRRYAFALAHLLLHASMIEELDPKAAGVTFREFEGTIVQMPLVRAVEMHDEFDRAVSQTRQRSEGRRDCLPQQEIVRQLRVLLSRLLLAKAEADWRAVIAPQETGRVLLHDWGRYDREAQRRWLTALLSSRPEAVAPFLRGCTNNDTDEASFSINQDFMRSMIEIEPLIAAANRAAANSGEAEDAQVIKTFLAWAKRRGSGLPG